MVTSTDELFVVSGTTGFIGSYFVKKLLSDERDLIIVGKEYKESSKNLTQHSPKTLKYALQKISKPIYFYHFATYFSKMEKDRDKIFDANISFGKTLLEILGEFQVSKIVYTNSMYKFQKENKNFYYTETKNKFSEIINSNLKKGNNFSEVYLDNTFGLNDPRDKVLNQIINNAMRGEESPVQKKGSYLNLSFVEDIVKTLYKEIESDSSVTRITSRFEYRLDSIFNFVDNFVTNDSKDASLLKSRDSIYLTMEGLPEINKNFSESDFATKLLHILMDRN